MKMTNDKNDENNEINEKQYHFIILSVSRSIHGYHKHCQYQNYRYGTDDSYETAVNYERSGKHDENRKELLERTFFWYL